MGRDIGVSTILQWQGNTCINAPVGWVIAITPWGQWDAVSMPFSLKGYGTKEHAKEECERVLLRLGILRLEWYCPHLPESSCKDELTEYAGRTAVITDGWCAPLTQWSIGETEGFADTRDEAKRIAEVLLVALGAT